MRIWLVRRLTTTHPALVALCTAAAVAAPPARAATTPWPGDLPEAELDRPYALAEASGVDAAAATRLLAEAVAGLYLPDEGVLRLLFEERSAAEVAAASLVGAGTLREFAARAFAEVAAGPSPSYVLKLPSRARFAARPAAGVPAGAAADGVVVSEGFEGDPWARWQRYPSSAAYDWTASACGARTGARSGDPVRGGTAGAQLACDADHPASVDNWIVDGNCEALAGAQEAWLEAYIHTQTSIPSDGSAEDYLAFYYGPDASGYWWGWQYWGTFDAWHHVVLNLRQWYYFGDLTGWSCARLAVAFHADESGQDGFGARVDDIEIRTGGGSSLTCAINATALAGTAPLTVAFQAISSGGTGTPTYSWSFGDQEGSTATGTQATFTYFRPGDYDAVLTVTRDGERCGASVWAAVDEPPYAYTISSQAHLPGTGGTQWRSNVAAVNRGAGAANLKLTYFPYSASAAPVVKTAVVGAGATVEWPDVLLGLFGQAGSPKGSVQVNSDQPISLIARTFNQAANGTYGQYYPAVAASQGLTAAAAEAGALAAGQLGVLPMLKKNAAFRTNVGILNLGDAEVTAAVTLYGAAGAKVGSVKSLTAEPRRYVQQDDIFANVGAGSQDIAYATVEVKTAGGRVWAYASVVDAVTGDPTTVPVLLAPGTGPFTISSQAHLLGTGGTQWRSNVAAVNRNATAANLTLTYFPYAAAGAPVAKNAAVPAGATVEWPDVLVGLFGQAGSPKGSVQVTADQPIYLIARTYNQAASGTYGQYYPAIAPAQALSAGQLGVLPMLKKSAAFRTNVGILNVGAAAVTVAVSLYDAAGAKVGTAKLLTAEPSRYVQQDDIFANVGAGAHEIAYATVEVQTAGGTAWAYASVVDAVTGDPTTIPVIVQ